MQKTHRERTSHRGWRSRYWGLAGIASLLGLGCHRVAGALTDQSDRLPNRVAFAAQEPLSGRPLSAHAANPLVRDGDAVFFVGNSFFGWQDRRLPEWVAALGRAVDPPIRIETGSDIVFGNTPLGEFLNHQATKDALASRKYSAFVLQAEEFEPVDHHAAFRKAVRDFDQAIRAAGGRTVLFMTWDFTWRRFIDRLSAAYDEIGRELDIPVIPVGLIYHDCNRAPYAGARPYWLTADAAHPEGELHQNEKGSAVNAYATFQMLTGIDPHGVNFVVHGNTNDDASMQYFSSMAWARVSIRLQRRF